MAVGIARQDGVEPRHPGVESGRRTAAATGAGAIERPRPVISRKSRRGRPAGDVWPGRPLDDLPPASARRQVMCHVATCAARAPSGDSPDDLGAHRRDAAHVGRGRARHAGGGRRHGTERGDQELGRRRRCPCSSTRPRRCSTDRAFVQCRGASPGAVRARSAAAVAGRWPGGAGPQPPAAEIRREQPTRHAGVAPPRRAAMRRVRRSRASIASASRSAANASLPASTCAEKGAKASGVVSGGANTGRRSCAAASAATMQSSRRRDGRATRIARRRVECQRHRGPPAARDARLRRSRAPGRAGDRRQGRATPSGAARHADVDVHRPGVTRQARPARADRPAT